MPNLLIQQPFEFISDNSGRPLSGGFIYIGQPNQDPEQFPLPVFFDEDGSISAPIPLRTNIAGYPTDGAGNPRRIYTTGEFSIRVRDKNGVQVYYSGNSLDGFQGVIAADLAGPNGAQLVGYRSGTVFDKLGRLGVDPKDFGAIGDGINDDQAAFESAVATGSSVLLPPGTYNVPGGDFTGITFYSFGGAQTNNGTIAIADVTASAFPVGAVMQFPCLPENLPVGFIPLDGSVLNRLVFPDLFGFANGSGNIVAEASWAANKMAFSTGNTTTTFRIPDARGLVVAGADNGAGVDADFDIGEVVTRTVTDGTEPATTDFNYGVQTIAIRAFSGAVNPGLIDVTALGSQVNGLQTELDAFQLEVPTLIMGIGQTPQDVTGSRSLSTVYTNTEDKAIFVYVQSTSATNANSMNLTVTDGVTPVVYAGNATGPSVNSSSCVWAVIPPGWTYEASGRTIATWLELRA